MTGTADTGARLSRRVVVVLTCAFVSAGLLALVASRVPQGLYADPAWQLRALQQFAGGTSPTPNTLIVPQAGDLSGSHAEWISWWAPGPSLLAYPMVVRGMAVGGAVRLIAIACILAGAVAWARWITLFELPFGVSLLLAVALPWSRYASNGFFMFSAETLVFAAGPVVLLCAHGVGTRWLRGHSRRWLGPIGLGLLLGAAYVLKYSLILPVAGVLGYLGVLVWRGRHDRGAARSAIFEWAIAFGMCALIVSGVSLVNRRMSGEMNLVTGGLAPHLALGSVVAAFAAPPLMFADLSAVLHQIFMRPGHPAVTSEWTLLAAGIPGACLLFWAVAKDPRRDLARGLALAAAASTILALTVLWNVSDSVSADARHAATAGMALSPLAVRAGLTAASPTGRFGRLLLAAGAVVYLIVPLVYGPVSVFGKLRRMPAEYRVGPSHLYNPLLSATDAAACRGRLAADFNPQRDVWYVTDPIAALDLGERAIIEPADFKSLEQLRTITYLTNSPVRVHVLLPPHFEDDGKGPVIRASFIHATGWTRSLLPECAVVHWSAVVSAP